MFTTGYIIFFNEKMPNMPKKILCHTDMEHYKKIAIEIAKEWSTMEQSKKDLYNQKAIIIHNKK